MQCIRNIRMPFPDSCALCSEFYVVLECDLGKHMVFLKRK